MNVPTLEAALADITQKLRDAGRSFALVGGLAVSFRAEVRFTRDVDLAVVVENDADFETLVYSLRVSGYVVVATVEQTQQKRLATARLQSPHGFVVDLMAASCGIEKEIVERATMIEMPGVGELPIARAEELLAMKTLSMSPRRLQDQLDVRNLILYAENLDLNAVKENLELIRARGFDRGEDLQTRWQNILADATRED
ncbi:MAG TPA: nucleotidyl transferase AbiEii/AbiGii toxin family protein [Polyangium sp.]|nr:nucleotidyl transferase AbiEii/AbiGii toxin family protein [Polyangium sp.]